MNPELHDAIHEIVLDLVNASEIGDKKSQWAAYQKLVTLCERSEKTGKNHPLQWETLGDFTNDKALAVGFYEKHWVIRAQRGLTSTFPQSVSQ